MKQCIIFVIVAAILLLSILACKKATSKRFIVDPTDYLIQYSNPPVGGMKIALMDSQNPVYPHILATPVVTAKKGQILQGADRPLEQIIVAITPKKEVWGGEINITRYDDVTGQQLERRVYKTHGHVGTRVTQYICPNDTTATNLTAAIEACKVPTYFAFDPARLVKPIVELDQPLTHSNIDERAYKANLYKNFDYDDVRPKSLFTRRQYEKMQSQNRSSYTRVSLSPRAGSFLNKADYYQTNPFQESPYALPVYNITLLNRPGIQNEGTDGFVKVALYNQLNGNLLAGPAVFNTYGDLAVGQAGQETIRVKGIGAEAVPLQFVIVGITNFDKSAWAGDVLVQSGRDEVSYQSHETEVGATRGELSSEFRCFDGSIYDNLDDAMVRCGPHREPMSEDISRQIYLESVPEQSF